jgi:hypothetical protein
MTEVTDKKYGRTFFDLIAEHPKFTFFTFLGIIVIVIVLMFLRIPFKIGNVEFGNEESAIHDTIINTKTEKEYIVNNPISVKTEPPKNLKKVNGKKISVNSGDTIVSVENQPANINTGTNNGIIGNNNDVKINVKQRQRMLNTLFSNKIVQAINETIEKNNVSDFFIDVAGLAGNNESLIFATEIFQFLKRQNYKVTDRVGQFQISPPFQGIQIDFDSTRKFITINIGFGEL